MATVMCGLAMSLDGFIADLNDDVGPLFEWYGNGDVAVPSPDPNLPHDGHQRWLPHRAVRRFKRDGLRTTTLRLYRGAGTASRPLAVRS